MTSAAELVRNHAHVLLDFDGPVCAVFGALDDETVADRLRTFLPEAAPDDVAAATDPFAVLRYSATQGVDVHTRVEGEFCRLEVAAVEKAPATPDAAEVMRRLHESGRTLTIVSNNSASAVNAYLRARSLDAYVTGVCSREPARPLVLKPHPHLLLTAMTKLNAQPTECVMVGDSVSDIQAAHRAQTQVIALANKRGKRERFEPHQPSAIIDHMSQLID